MHRKLSVRCGSTINGPFGARNTSSGNDINPTNTTDGGCGCSVGDPKFLYGDALAFWKGDVKILSRQHVQNVVNGAQSAPCGLCPVHPLPAILLLLNSELTITFFQIFLNACIHLSHGGGPFSKRRGCEVHRFLGSRSGTEMLKEL